MKRPSAQLIAEWYAKLRASGFRDIEDGVRPGKLEWTFRSSQRRSRTDATQVAVFVSWPHGFEPQGALAEHPTAVYYRGLEHAARALKGRQRKLVLAASNGSSGARERDRLRLTGEAMIGNGPQTPRRTASYQVRKFAIATGLLREAHGS